MNRSKKLTTVLRRSKDTIKKIFTSKKRIIEFSLTILLLILGLAVYLTLSDKKGDILHERYDYTNKELNEGTNAYRLENFDKAEILFLKAIESTRRKKVKSLAALYLGNIYYKMNNYNEAIDYFQRSLFYNKKNVHALYNSALASLKNGDSGKALKYALLAFDIKDDYLPNLLLLGNIFYATEKYSRALSTFNRSEDSDAVVKFNKACAYLRLGEIARAENLLHSIIDDTQSNQTLKGVSFFTLGYIKQNNDVERAVHYLQSALDIFPSSAVLKYNLSLILLKQENYPEIATLLRSVKGRLKDIEFNALFGRALFQGRYYKEALDFYTDLYDQTNDADISYIIGDIYVKLNNVKMAKHFYEIASKDPENEGALINLIHIYLDEGNYKEAAVVCNDFLLHEKDDPLPYTCLAEVCFRMENTAAAKENLEKAVLYSKDNVQDLMRIAMVYQENRYYSNALQLYHRIISIDSTFHWAHGGIAEIYLNTGHLEKAKNIISRIRNNIEDAGLFYKLSILLAQADATDNGLHIYNELIRDFPYQYEAYQNLSLRLIDTGEYEKAIYIIEKCLQNITVIDKKILSNLYSILGIAQRFSGNDHEAINAFKTAYDLDGGNEIPLLNIKMISVQANMQAHDQAQ